MNIFLKFVAFAVSNPQKRSDVIIKPIVKHRPLSLRPKQITHELLPCVNHMQEMLYCQRSSHFMTFITAQSP